jgi:hypothetical protein
MSAVTIFLSCRACTSQGDPAVRGVGAPPADWPAWVNGLRADGA